MYIPICFAYIIPATACCKAPTNNQTTQIEEEEEEGTDGIEPSTLQLRDNHEEEEEPIMEQAFVLRRRRSEEQREEEEDLNERVWGDHMRDQIEPMLSSRLSSSSAFTPASSSVSDEVQANTPGQQPPQQQQEHERPLTFREEQQQPLTFRDFAIMGALDALATTMQIYATAYLPGPLLILLPQAAVPLSLLASLKRRRREQTYFWTQYLGAGVIALGVLMLMEPLWTNRLAAPYYCEAVDVDNDCTICKFEIERETCLSHLPTYDDDDDGDGDNASVMFLRILQHDLTTATATTTDITTDGILPHDTTPNDSLCQWIPFEDATREEEVLTSVWSSVLIASCIPMILSTIYKDWAMEGSEAASRKDYPIYLNGWIAVFQLFFSIPLSFVGGLASAPAIQEPLKVMENLWYGFQCYLVGSGSITSGCHPDVLCGTYSFWLVNLHLFASLGYSYCMLFCLKYGTTTLFFLALTIMVPRKCQHRHGAIELVQIWFSIETLTETFILCLM